MYFYGERRVILCYVCVLKGCLLSRDNFLKEHYDIIEEQLSFKAFEKIMNVLLLDTIDSKTLNYEIQP